MLANKGKCELVKSKIPTDPLRPLQDLWLVGRKLDSDAALEDEVDLNPESAYNL